LFLLENDFPTNRFQACVRSMMFWRFVFRKNILFPKVPQKCPGGVWNHSRPIRDHFGPILYQNRLKKYIRNTPIKIHIKIPHSYPQATSAGSLETDRAVRKIVQKSGTSPEARSGTRKHILIVSIVFSDPEQSGEVWSQCGKSGTSPERCAILLASFFLMQI